MPIKTNGVYFDEVLTDPPTPTEGEMWYNATDGKYKIYYQGATYLLVDTGNLAEVDHTKISNRGNHTHLELDGHVDSQENPHVVTADQVGKDVAQWNADRLQNKNVAITTPVDGDILTWNNSNSSWEPKQQSSLFGRL